MSTDTSRVFDQIVKNKDPLVVGLLMLSRCLKTSKSNLRWKTRAMRELVKILQNSREPFGVRARAISAGYNLSTGKIAVLYMQNDGFGKITRHALILPV